MRSNRFQPITERFAIRIHIEPDKTCPSLTRDLNQIYLSAWWVISRLADSIDVVHLHEKAVFYYCILAVLLGAQFLLAGLLAELVVARTDGPDDTFSVAERLPAGTNHAESDLSGRPS